MPIASFDELCKGLCEIAGFPPPALMTPEEEGNLAFSMRLRGVVISALQPSRGRGGTALLIAQFGAMPPELEPAGWLGLLDANFFLMDEDAPRFSRNPKTGEIILQWNCPLGALSVTDAFLRASRMVDLARSWHSHHVLGAPDSGVFEWGVGRAPPLAADDPVAVQAAANFRLLHQGVSEALGHAAAPASTAVADQRFPLRLEELGVDVTIAHSPFATPGLVFVAVKFGLPAADAVLERVTALMEANFALTMERRGATFCRDPWSGELLLLYAYPLAQADPEDFLFHVVRLGMLAAAWQQPASESLTES